MDPKADFYKYLLMFAILSRRFSRLPPKSFVLISREKDLIFNFSLSFIIFSSGKSFPMNTVLTPLELTTATLICNLSVLTCTIMKLLVENMFPVQSWWILNLVLWTQLGQDPMGKFSDQITLFLANRELEITGQRDTTQKVNILPYLICLLIYVDIH